MLSRLARCLALGAILFLPACAPVVTHGPRVLPGPEYGAAAGWSRPLCDSCRAGLVPPIGAIARYGWTPDGPEGAGYGVGIMIPGVLLLPAATLDFYAQAPAPVDAMVAGGGVTVSVHDVMPYLQVGRTDARGTGWYTTQGLAFAAYRPELEVILNGGRGTVFDNVAAVYWSPTVAYKGEEFTAYLSGALGSHDAAAAGEPERPQLLSAILFGVAVDTPELLWPLLPPARRRD